MLLIQKSQANTLIVTLDELKSESLPNNWLFVFTSEQSKKYQYKLYLTDISLYPERYNDFTLTEGTDVTFKFKGDYKYQVYQMPDGGSTDETLGRLVETGKAKIIEAVTPTPTHSTNVQTPIYDADAIS